MNIKKIFDLSGRVVVLTGAAGILGSRYSEGLSQAGSNVVLADKNYEKCKKLAYYLEKQYGVNPLSIKLDVTNINSIKKMVTKILKKYHKIDVLINNAIFPEGKKERSIPFEKFPISYWNKIFAVNVTGMFLCCQEIGKIMVKQKSGVIINIGSMYGLNAPDQRIYKQSKLNSTVAYATTKSAVLNFTRYLASYWHKDGIRVNTLSLGGVKNFQNSDLIKNYSYKTMIGRMAHSNEYVGAILFLASDASSYMTGSNLIIDGGYTAW